MMFERGSGMFEAKTPPDPYGGREVETWYVVVWHKGAEELVMLFTDRQEALDFRDHLQAEEI
jgi:hypothetical protein